MDEFHTEIRKALPADAEDFAVLVLTSSPSLFPAIYGDRAKNLMKSLFCQRRNLFSFGHTYFAELNGKKAGMVLGYGWRAKRREDWRTGFLLLKQMKIGLLTRLPQMIKVEGVIGMVGYREYYISNIAVYPEYRAAGVGTRLISGAEEEAKKSSAERVALDVEVENTGAFRLYKRLGYSVADESTVQLRGGRSFSFHRMCKELE